MTRFCRSIEKYPQGLKTGYRIPKKKPSENKDWKEPSNKDKWGNSLDKYFQGQDATYGRHRYVKSLSECVWLPLSLPTILNSLLGLHCSSP
jgi:hypothetical protein